MLHYLTWLWHFSALVQSWSFLLSNRLRLQWEHHHLAIHSVDYLQTLWLFFRWQQDLLMGFRWRISLLSKHRLPQPEPQLLRLFLPLIIHARFQWLRQQDLLAPKPQVYPLQTQVFSAQPQVFPPHSLFQDWLVWMSPINLLSLDWLLLGWLLVPQIQ